jgi:DNA excision repair protein ERCC-5
VYLRHPQDAEEEELPDGLVYVDELHMTARERQQNRRFKKKDAYHLPDLEVSLEEMGAPNDPRIMSHEELQEYARQFHNGEDVNMYDFSKIDFDSPFFQSLPPSDRYNILNAARLRSRLRMGYSKDQLDSMFPDRMAFSRFQIERVAERNELTQRLMNINGMNDEQWVNSGARVAGEKGREYVLVKNDGVEGGWVLGVVGGKDQGARNKPIDVERLDEPVGIDEDQEGWESDDGFEDVPIEGLNRLPKRSHSSGIPLEFNDDDEVVEIANRRRVLYESRRQNNGEGRQGRQRPRVQDPNSLFITDDECDEGWEDVNEQNMAELFEDTTGRPDEDDEELNRAIAMSLDVPSPVHQEEDEDLNRAIAMSLEQPRFTDGSSGKGKGRLVDWSGDYRSSNLGSGLQPDNDSDGDDVDIQAILDESRRMQSRRQPESGPGEASRSAQAQKITSSSSGAELFDGPLPFEKLDFSKSILKGKRIKPSDNAGGFEKEQKEKVQPLPPWFSSGTAIGPNAGRRAEDQEFDGGKAGERDRSYNALPLASGRGDGIIEIDTPESESGRDLAGDVPVDSDLRIGIVPDVALAIPPNPKAQENLAEPERGEFPGEEQETDEEPFEWEESDREEMSRGENSTGAVRPPSNIKSPSPVFGDVEILGSEVLENLEGSNRENPVVDAYDSELFGEDDADQYSDPEDEELMRQLAVESEEHARFASELNQKSKLQNQEDYERELKALRNQQKKDRRDADEVSNIMVIECQQLLTLFGLPYVTAPMEAEAQCAELVRLGLVDGIVTDDSDTFLFGGTRVYKNMFNQARFVECYLASDLEKEFDLDRRKLIRMAHLLGSDYTDGLPGVGPVTALEILSDFNSEGGLKEFKEWWHRVQTGTQGPDDLKTSFRKKFKRNANKIFLAPTFPDERVDTAYLEPSVDSDPTAFQWGVPDLDALRSFLMTTIGWSQEHTDEVLVPVIKDMNRRENEGTQANITSYFTGRAGAGAFAPRRRDANKSKRMENAMTSLHEQAKRKRGGTEQRRRSKSVSSSGGSEVEVTTTSPASRSASGDGYQGAPKKIQKRSRGSPSRRGGAKTNT